MTDGTAERTRRHMMIHIRRATNQDNRLLADIGAETFYESFAADNRPENMAAYLSSAFSPAIQGAELADPRSRFLLAEVDGAAAGYMHLKFTAAPPQNVGRKPVKIARLYTRKPWQGKGVGAGLMQQCLQDAASAGCDVAWLGVWEKNPRAIAFYRKWGFVAAGYQPFRLGDELQQDLVMARRLVHENRPAIQPVHDHRHHPVRERLES